MPGTRCTVAVCNSSRERAVKENKEIHFYTFPKDPKLRREWVVRCRRVGKWNPNSCHVCSLHFKEADFVRDLQNELLGLPKRRTLKPDAVPSLILTPGRNDVPATTAREQRLYKKPQKQIGNHLLSTGDVNQESDPMDISGTSLSQIPGTSADTGYDVLTGKYEHAIKELMQLQKESEGQRQAVLKVNEKLKNEKEGTRQLIKTFEHEKKKEVQKIDTLMKLKLSGTLSENLTDTILGQNKVIWTPEELEAASTLQNLSKKFYLYLREKKIIHFQV